MKIEQLISNVKISFLMILFSRSDFNSIFYNNKSDFDCEA